MMWCEQGAKARNGIAKWYPTPPHDPRDTARLDVPLVKSSSRSRDLSARLGKHAHVTSNKYVASVRRTTVMSTNAACDHVTPGGRIVT